VELDGRRSLTCGVGRKTRSGSGLWDVEGLLRRIGTKAHSRRNSSECVGILIPLVIVFVVSASSPQARHRYSHRNQQQPAYL
jgi:hypothetical protein